MKSIATCFSIALAASVIIVLCSRPVESQDTQPTAAKAKIKNLLVERRETLSQLLEAVTLQYQAGTATLDLVIRAQNDLLDAELQLANTKAERIQIYEKRLQNSRNLEDTIKERHAAGAAPMEMMLAAKAARLEAEIELLREQIARD